MSDSFVVPEGDSVTLLVSRIDGSAGEATVLYRTSSDSALASSDYDPLEGMLHWSDGDDAEKVITVRTVDDEEVEQDETFTLVLFKPSGGVLGASTMASVVVRDDDVFRTPTVVTTEPASGSVDVLVESHISIQFSESMDRASVEEAFGSSPAVACSFSWSVAGDVVTCVPDAQLSFSTVYGVTVGATAQSSAGVPLENAHTFEFTTRAADDTTPPDPVDPPPTDPVDSTPPTVESNTPVDGATSVSLGATIEIAFSEEMDRPSVEAAFVSSPAVACQYAWSVAGDRVICDPASDLSPGTRYTITIQTSAADLAGNDLVSVHRFSFSTAVDPSQPPTTQGCVLGSGVLGQCTIGN